VADRVDYYFRQRVTEAELDLGFELLERADRNLAADIGVYGVVGGAVPTQHAPIADLTIDLTAPGRAYDRLGQRIFFGSGQTVNLAVDSTGIPTDVSTVGQERWIGVFVRFHRLLSDPRTDGNSQQVFFRRDESFQVVVRQGAQAAAGSAPKVALVDDELLLCDVRRSAGQTQILSMDIDISRRQAFLFAQGTAVGVVAGLWKALTKTATSVQAALDAVDTLFFGHFGATANRHAAQDVDYPPHGFITSKTVRGALDELVDDLSSTDAAGPGGSKIGVDALTGIPNALAAGSIRGHISQLLAWLNAHVGAAVNAHAASAIGATPHSFVASTSVQAQLQELGTDLQSAAPGQGGSLIGSQALGGSPRAVTATNVHDQLVATLTHVNAHIGSGDHDGRYLRRVFSNAQNYAAGEQKDLGAMPGGSVDELSVKYSTVDGSGTAQDPRYGAGVYTWSIQAWISKGTGGHLFVKNTAGVPLYIAIDAFKVG
jgi:hypothetical protein